MSDTFLGVDVSLPVKLTSNLTGQPLTESSTFNVNAAPPPQKGQHMRSFNNQVASGIDSNWYNFEGTFKSASSLEALRQNLYTELLDALLKSYPKTGQTMLKQRWSPLLKRLERYWELRDRVGHETAFQEVMLPIPGSRK